MGIISYHIFERNNQTIEKIESILSGYEGVIKTGTSSSFDEMMNSILQKMPKIIFFDMNSLPKSLCDLSTQISKYTNYSPVIIGLSKSKKNAYTAIKNNYFDYLLKPISELELRKSILRYKKTFDKETKKTICIKSYKDYRYLHADEILFLKADNNTTDFYLNDNTIVSAYKTLKTFENILPDNFLRIHKSYIINKNYVSRIQFGKSVCSIKSFTHHIPFTKTYIGNIQLLNKTLEETSYISLN